MSATLPDQARLVNAGWDQTRSNKWTHPAFMASADRRRLFALDAALALLDASESVAAAGPMVS